MNEAADNGIYRSTQTGWVIWYLCGFFILYFGLKWFFTRIEELTYVLPVLLILLSVVLILFHNLTIVVDEQRIYLSFGIGLIRKQFSLKDVQEVKPVRNRWWHGWGIHWWPGYMIYNISGFDAVELTLKDRRLKVRIGTKEPGELGAFIRQKIREAGFEDAA